MNSPYEGRPPRSFWKTGVSEQDPLTITDLYRKRFQITRDTRVAAAGSCFAQHISRHLRKRNFHVIDTEPAPESLPLEQAQNYGYSIYSARFGNIYLVRQLLQLAKEAYGEFRPAEAVWVKNGRYYDAMRPSVEPDGLESAEAVAIHRKSHLAHVRELFEQAEIFVFTMGLTEAWIHKASGTVYPTAPGTIAGSFDPDVFAFHNFGFEEILDDFEEFRLLVKEHNPDLRFLLTVSPVPLTATASQLHVLPATTYSKSVLRAVAGELYSRYADIDYFPSYEIISSPFSKGMFYEPNMRSVKDEGVSNVMRVFFDQHDNPDLAEEPAPAPEVEAARSREGSVEARRAAREVKAARREAGGRSREEAREAKAARRGADGPRAREDKAARRQEKLERRTKKREREGSKEEDVVCEDILLEAFAR
jgi:hypothetical protein